MITKRAKTLNDRIGMRAGDPLFNRKDELFVDTPDSSVVYRYMQNKAQDDYDDAPKRAVFGAAKGGLTGGAIGTLAGGALGKRFRGGGVLGSVIGAGAGMIPAAQRFMRSRDALKAHREVRKLPGATQDLKEGARRMRAYGLDPDSAKDAKRYVVGRDLLNRLQEGRPVRGPQPTLRAID